MDIRELFASADLAEFLSSKAQGQVAGVVEDSRLVRSGDVFVAVRGTQVDGHRFIDDATQRGACAVVVEEPVTRDKRTLEVVVPDTRRALGRLAHGFNGHPSRAMEVVGVTGTNGKTTTVFLLESIFQSARRRTGVLGTVVYRTAEWQKAARVTTPSATEVADCLGRMLREGVKVVMMEVSSHAVDQGRIEGLHFRAGVLTNITQDHLDYHRDMTHYVATKRRFFFDFLLPEPESIALFNIDDPQAATWVREYPGQRVTYGTRDNADVRAEGVSLSHEATELTVSWSDGERLTLRSSLLGAFNAANILAAAATARSLGLPLEAIRHGVEHLHGVPGRFERIEEGQSFLVFVDYAHTPDALSRLLANAREIASARIITVFGCGGDRDPSKRPLMGEAVGRGSDVIFLTNDNPRTEDPETIADAAEEGVRRALRPGTVFERVLDRRQAIEQALREAQEGDVVLIAGKGHEDYQILGRERVHFDDREVAREVLRKLRSD